MRQNERYWMTIDVGILHLGLVVVKITKDWEFERIIWHRLENITIMKHNRVPLNDCTLYHTASITDRMAHVYQEYENIFDSCDRILIERQPIQGLMCVQESLVSKFRHKIEIVSPNQMHKFFSISDKNYEERKVATVDIARRYFRSKENFGDALENSEKGLLEKFEQYRDKNDCSVFRQHDIADAICILVVVIDKKRKNYLKKMSERENIEELKKNGKVDLSVFRRKIKSQYF